MELPPYREMPPEVRLRLRGRVLPSLSARSSPRAPYVVAAAIVVFAALALYMLSAKAAPPPTQNWAAPTTTSNSAADERMADQCRVSAGTWRVGAYLRRTNGDGVQLGVKDGGVLGICLISNGHPTPSTWGSMMFQQLGDHAGSYQAVHENGLVYGTIGPQVASVTVNGAPAVVANGTFVAEAEARGAVTITTRDAQGKVLDQGTIS